MGSDNEWVMDTDKDRAFPRYNGATGMTLRDWYKGKAMKAYISTLDCGRIWHDPFDLAWAKEHTEHIARVAGLYADAMIQEKLKRETASTSAESARAVARSNMPETEWREKAVAVLKAQVQESINPYLAELREVLAAAEELG